MLKHKVIETKSFGDTRRYTVGVNPVSGKLFQFAGSLASVQHNDGSWSHAIGHNGCGYVNWEISHHDGINPNHINVDFFDVDYNAIPEWNNSY